MRYVVLIFVVLTLSLHAQKTDIFFANGILTSEPEAIKNSKLLEDNIKDNLYLNNLDEYKKDIGEVTYAYNHTNGQLNDLFESLLQKANLHQTIDFVYNLFFSFLESSVHDTDLSKQLAKYREILESGKKVLTVAHSQGNLFTIEVYNALTVDEGKNFNAISIASPAHSYITDNKPEKNPFFSWDNDLVAHLGLYGSKLIDNPVRKVQWKALKPGIGLGTVSKEPNDHYV